MSAEAAESLTAIVGSGALGYALGLAFVVIGLVVRGGR